MNRRRVFSFVLFLFGFLIVLYPLALRTYHDYQYRKEVTEIEDEFSEEFSFSEYEQQLSYNKQNSEEEIEVADVGFASESMIASDFDDEGLLGTISIPKIDLNYPIYDGATDENLYRGVARIEGTGYPVGGENTHSVIAGHNGLVGKTYFSDIKKLENGDIIEVRNAKEDLSYEVYQTDVIEPTDVGALEVIEDQDTLTLLTCTYPPPGTHRYLVYAKRVSPAGEVVGVEGSEEVRVPEIKEKSVMDKLNIFLVRYGKILLLLLSAFVVSYFIFIKKPRSSKR